MSKSALREPSLPIYSALLLPTITAQPSPRSVQWSADGQICFVNESSIVILTPDHGINFDSASTVKSAPQKDDPVLGWFKTMIQKDHITPMRWPNLSQSWGAASLGSIDLALTCLAISPTGISSSGGCVFATLSSNMDLNLWTADKNYLKGEWKNIFELTPFLVKHFHPGDEPDVVSVLKSQIACIEWTPQAPFDVHPMPANDASLLILGSRAGCLTFVRHRNNADPEVVATLPVADGWITHLAFSSWNTIAPGWCEGYIAYGTSDGSVGFVKVKQELKEIKDTFSFSTRYDIDALFEKDSNLIYGSETRAGITSMRWVHVPGRSAILVVSYPGLIKLWSAPSAESSEESTPHWVGVRLLRLQTQKISLDSSAFHPVTGVAYLRKQDRLVITLFDGSFHVIRNFSSDPNWATRSAANIGEDQLTSEGLSLVSRATSSKAEKEQVSRKDMLRIDGAVLYDDNNTFLWVYESTRPSDFSYKHDAKHCSTLIAAQIWKDDDDDYLLRNLGELLDTIKTSSGFSPLHLLRPYLLHLRNPIKLEALHPKFLDLLEHHSQIDHSIQVSLRELTQELNDDVRQKFRQSISVNLFGWDDLLSLRMKLSLADFAWKLASNEQNQNEIGLIAQGLLNTISHRVLRIIVRHLFAVHRALSDEDVPFVSRVIAQSMLPGCPPDLAEEGQKLYILTRTLIEGNGAVESTVPSDEIVNKLKESCPACGLEIPLQDITTAACANGHTWARCSVTTFILSTPWTRTCVGCSRKAFVPPTELKALPLSARGWVVENLLKAVNRCLFCSNGFVSIL